MRTQIIDIGNSKGIRLPKKILELAKISDEVELIFQNETLMITPIEKKPRQGWELLFTTENKKLIVDIEFETQFIENEFDKSDWIW